jgi:4-amino-4-deoxy-L-arabinose transferase-like glycosyltransferase
MSTLTQPTQAPTHDRTTTPMASAESRDRIRRRVSLLVTLVVLAWSTVELINLGANHTTGPELYGVAVAALAVAAGVLSLALLASNRKRLLASAAVLLIWAIVAIGGVAGAVAHVIGPVQGHGPVDVRPRPVAAPLVFTALGLVGGAALFYGARMRSIRVRESGKE